MGGDIFLAVGSIAWSSSTTRSCPVQEEFYIEQSVEKGIEIDAWKANSLASSMVDDIFFILQKCSQRGLATANLQCVGAIMGQINTALSTSLRAALDSRWKVAVPSTFLLDFLSCLSQPPSGCQLGGSNHPLP
jgi:hypothetical protein